MASWNISYLLKSYTVSVRLVYVMCTYTVADGNKRASKKCTYFESVLKMIDTVDSLVNNSALKPVCTCDFIEFGTWKFARSLYNFHFGVSIELGALFSHSSVVIVSYNENDKAAMYKNHQILYNYYKFLVYISNINVKYMTVQPSTMETSENLPIITVIAVFRSFARSLLLLRCVKAFCGFGNESYALSPAFSISNHTII